VGREDVLIRPIPSILGPIPVLSGAFLDSEGNPQLVLNPDGLIRETGYGRREAELHLLEARLKHRQDRPEEARAALARAESRLRAIGQWGLWPELLRVAAELGLPAPVIA
jgi:chemotaxis protein histidine kinase CheA